MNDAARGGTSSPNQIAEKPEAKEADPHIEAELMLDAYSHESVRRLIFWNGGFLMWIGGQYVHIPNSEAKALVVRWLNQTYEKVGLSVINNVLEHVRAGAMLSSHPASFMGIHSTCVVASRYYCDEKPDCSFTKFRSRTEALFDCCESESVHDVFNGL